MEQKSTRGIVITTSFTPMERYKAKWLRKAADVSENDEDQEKVGTRYKVRSTSDEVRIECKKFNVVIRF